jgi:hypothetical protein
VWKTFNQAETVHLPAIPAALLTGYLSGDEEPWSASAFPVLHGDSLMVFTAAHALENTQRINLRIGNRLVGEDLQHSSAQDWVINARMDVAYLEIPRSQVGEWSVFWRSTNSYCVPELASGGSSLLTMLQVPYHSASRRARHSETTVPRIWELDGRQALYLVDREFREGQSGSPVFREGSFGPELAGLVLAGFMPDEPIDGIDQLTAIVKVDALLGLLPGT